MARTIRSRRVQGSEADTRNLLFAVAAGARTLPNTRGRQRARTQELL